MKNRKMPRLISAIGIVEKYNISYQTLNYYSNLDLIDVAETEGRRRLFDEEAIKKRLAEIKALKIKGYSLKAIRYGFKE